MSSASFCKGVSIRTIHRTFLSGLKIILIKCLRSSDRLKHHSLRKDYNSSKMEQKVLKIRLNSSQNYLVTWLGLFTQDSRSRSARNSLKLFERAL